MLKLSPLSSLLLVSGIAVAAGFACSSGGVVDDGTIQVPTTGGTDASSAGTGSPGTSGSPSTAGTSTTTGGTGSGGSGQAGAQASGGTDSGMAGTGTGGTGAGGTGTGGTGGGATGFCGSEAGKVMLFDGTDATFKNWYPRTGGMNAANPWTLNSDGTMTVKGSDLISKMGFQNVCLHVEYQAPNFTYPAGTDAQQRGNSGVYLKASWELQVLDSYALGQVKDDYCGAIYKVAAPLVSACKTGGEWNAYDIEFQANVCADGMTTTAAKFIKVNLNGTNVHNNVELPKAAATQDGLTPTCEPRGVLLQNHGSLVPVSYRNIWAIPRP